MEIEKGLNADNNKAASMLGKLNCLQDKNWAQNKNWAQDNSKPSLGSLGQERKRTVSPIKVRLNKNTQEQAEEERKLKLEFKKHISEEYAKPFNPPANVTAASYIIYEPAFSKTQRKKVFLPTLEESRNPKFPHSHKVIASFNSRNSTEVASLTKIMTCFVALELCDRFKLHADQQKIGIGKFESNIAGTSARIS